MQFDLAKLKQRGIEALPLVLFIILFLSLVHLAKQRSPNRDDAKLEELKQVSAQVPLPSGFTEVATHYSSRSIDAGVYKSYQSSASYDTVRNYYIGYLTPKGWRLTNEDTTHSIVTGYDHKKLTFQKDSYSINIEYSGENPSDGSSNYSVSFKWFNR